MATLKDYFEGDNARFSEVTWDNYLKELDTKGESIDKVLALKLHFSFHPRFKFWSMYASDDVSIERIFRFLAVDEVRKCNMLKQAENAEISLSNEQGIDLVEPIKFSELTFTKAIILYYDKELTNAEKIDIVNRGKSLELKISIRDRLYAKKKSMNEKPLAFISHDSRDKDGLVRDLVNELKQRDCPVWYDEYSLQVGDSLRESIENGLTNAPKCILIISKNFLENKGWTKSEYNAIFTKELLEERKVILPIWHEVSAKEVYNYSPILADKFSLGSDIGIRSLALKLKDEIQNKI